MTTPSERKFIYDLYVELKRRVKFGEELMQSNYGIGFHGGVMDDDELDKITKERDQRYDVGKTSVDVCTSIWNFVLSKYSKWDIELAIQENEGRIGDIPFV